MASEVPFLQLFCRWSDCGEMFFVCRPCYRGQAYCSPQCRRQSRQQQRRKANRRYEQDPEVRRDRRDYQRDYRKRLREICVTDQSSVIVCGLGSISEPAAKIASESPAEEEVHIGPKRTWRERFGRIVCIICGRVGNFVAAFVRRE